MKRLHLKDAIWDYEAECRYWLNMWKQAVVNHLDSLSRPKLK